MICEKPLAMTSAQSAEMVALARASGQVAAVCYNTRFYPLNQHARGMVAAGELGEVRLVTGQLPSGLAGQGHRLELAAGGGQRAALLRSVGDIGTHWVDLTSFITGHEAPCRCWPNSPPSSPNARSPSARSKPSPPTTGATETRRIETDDAATILLRYSQWRAGHGLDQPDQPRAARTR